MTKLPKKYKRLEVEEQIFKIWKEENLFDFSYENISEEKPLFSIDTPPPYTNASWHMGSTVHYLTIDMIARMQRMKGYTVHFPMGLDRNGLPIEIAAEEEFDVNMHEIERGEFLQLCNKLLDQYGSKVLEIAYKIGMSCNSFDWDKVYKTDQDQYRALTQATFIEMWDRGLIYEDDRPNNWDYRLKTTIADAEIEYKQGVHTLYDIQFTVKETGEQFHFATTRPELIPAIRVVVYHPDDTRYQELEGQTAVTPIWGIEVPIKAHQSADPEFGSGLMQVCSYGDIQDVRILREMQADPIYAIDIDGKLTSATGKYQGMAIKQGRQAIVKDLRDLGVILSEKEIPYNYPVSERSGAPIEFIGMPEYYLKQEVVKDKLNQMAEDLQFHPASKQQIWKDWLNVISMDWPISRRRFYGTEVPIWHCLECNHSQVPKPGKYYQPWKDEAPFKKCEECGHGNFKGDERTFDTWMDSSISPLYILKYPNNKESQKLLNYSLDRDYLCDLRPQGKDIVRTWLHYTMLRIWHLYNKPAFKHAWISGHVVTDIGTKMSKSKGTGVEPLPIIEKYGGDALRLFAAMEGSHGSDIRFSEDRLRGGAKFLNKLYNIAKFVSLYEKPSEPDKLMDTDSWILGELGKVLDVAMQGYEKFDPHPAAKALRNFTQELFSSHYMEMVKTRAYNKNNDFRIEQSNSAKFTLYKVLDSILKYFAPITPFLTDYLYRNLFKKSIHQEIFPDLSNYKPILVSTTSLLLSFNQAIWGLKKENGLSLRAQLKEIEIPEELEIFLKDLKSMHNIESIEISDRSKANEIQLDQGNSVGVVLV